MDVSATLFEISKAVHRDEDFGELIKEQKKYLDDRGRLAVCILVTYDMVGTLVRLAIKDTREADKVIAELVERPRFLFLFEGWPVYFNPRLRTVPAMVVAEPRFWIRADKMDAKETDLG